MESCTTSETIHIYIYSVQIVLATSFCNEVLHDGNSLRISDCFAPNSSPYTAKALGLL